MTPPALRASRPECSWPAARVTAPAPARACPAPVPGRPQAPASPPVAHSTARRAAARGFRRRAAVPARLARASASRVSCPRARSRLRDRMRRCRQVQRAREPAAVIDVASRSNACQATGSCCPVQPVMWRAAKRTAPDRLRPGLNPGLASSPTDRRCWGRSKDCCSSCWRIVP